MAALPLPQATSTTRQPACRSTDAERMSATGWIKVAMAWKSPLAHISLWRVFTCARSGADVVSVLVNIFSFAGVEGIDGIAAAAARHRRSLPICFRADTYLSRLSQRRRQTAPR